MECKQPKEWLLKQASVTSVVEFEVALINYRNLPMMSWYIYYDDETGYIWYGIFLKEKLKMNISDNKIYLIAILV